MPKSANYKASDHFRVVRFLSKMGVIADQLGSCVDLIVSAGLHVKPADIVKTAGVMNLQLLAAALFGNKSKINDISKCLTGIADIGKSIVSTAKDFIVPGLQINLLLDAAMLIGTIYQQVDDGILQACKNAYEENIEKPGSRFMYKLEMAFREWTQMQDPVGFMYNQ